MTTTGAAGGAPDQARVRDLLERYFRQRPAGSAAVYLFGSVARGEARAASDIDVAILCDQDPERTVSAIPVELEAELGAVLGFPVQVVVLNHAPADLIHRVLRDGILIAEPDRSRRIAFEVRARNDYFDLLPILRRYRGLAGRAHD